MTSEPARLLQPESQERPPAPRLAELLEAARRVNDDVHRALAVAPRETKPYLTAAEKYLMLAVSSLAIAQLAETDGQ